MIPYLALLAECLIGVGTFAVIWRLGLPKPLARVRVPRSLDVPITLDSDYRGLV